MPVDDIRHRIEKDFGYDLSMCVEELRPWYSWNILDEAGNGGMCQGINGSPDISRGKLFDFYRKFIPLHHEQSRIISIGTVDTAIRDTFKF